MQSFAIGWLTDRLYEAGADDTVSVLGGLQVPTSQMGAVLAASGMTITAVALLVQKELLPVRILRAIGRKDKESAAAKDAAQAPKEGSSNTNGDSTVPKASRPAEIPGMIFSDGKDSAMDMLERVRRSVESQQRWSAAVSALQEFVQWATLSSSFLVTGNLLAPIAGSVAVDAVFSVYQRKRAKEMIEARAAEALQFTSQLQDTRELAKAVASSRKERLRPSQDGDNNALDENIGMHVGESAQEEEGSANDNDESKREE